MIFNPLPKPPTKKRKTKFKLPPIAGTKKSNGPGKMITGWILALAIILATFWGLGMMWDSLTIAGVPLPVIEKFVMDPVASKAYIAGNKKLLHDRLKQLGVEEEIKAFYRPKIQDEIQLDWYIHQLMYDLTGYVGEIYQVNSRGILELKPDGEQRLMYEFKDNQFNPSTY